MTTNKQQQKYEKIAIELRDRSREWLAPAVVYEDEQFGTDYEPLGCDKMEVNIDFYWSTAVVSIHGEWTNYLNEEKDFIFVLRQRGSITDATIKVEGKHIRTIANVTQQTITDAISGKSVGIKASGNEKLPQWSDKEKVIFRNSTPSKFFLPFNGVDSGDKIHIDCEYVESLRIVDGYYYFHMPLSFFDRETSQCMFIPTTDVTNDDDQDGRGPYQKRVRVSCRINHANSMIVEDWKCPSHEIQNSRSEKSYLEFSTNSFIQHPNFKTALGIGSNTSAFSDYFQTLAAQRYDTEDDTHEFGRPFELYFKYGFDEASLTLEKQKFQSKYKNEDLLSNFINVHAINNPLRQDFNWQFAQAKRRERKDHHTIKTNENDNWIVNDLDTSLASVGLYMSATQSESIRRDLPIRPTVMYFVVNVSQEMIPIFNPHIIEPIAVRLSELKENDCFGICLFSENNTIRHYIKQGDEDYKSMNVESDDNDNDDNENVMKESERPRVYKIREWLNSVNNNNNFQSGGIPNHNSNSSNDYNASLNSNTSNDYGRGPNDTLQQEWQASWQAALTADVAQWLATYGQNHQNKKRKRKQKINISTPLIQTLLFLESDLMEYKKDYFKQIIFIHHGFKQTMKHSDPEIIDFLEATQNNQNGKKKNKKTINNTDNDEKDLANETTDPMLRQMQSTINSNNKSAESFQFDDTSSYDLGEQDLMNKIAFFYSDKAKEFLKIDPYTTRIHTVALGNRTNLSFLEYLSRNTRGFCARCFDMEDFGWDLTNFLGSIRSPFVTFDNRTQQAIEFIYTQNDGGSSQLSFPFPMPDLYLDRPLVLKFYVESKSRLKDLIINGTYLVPNDIMNINNNHGNNRNNLKNLLTTQRVYAMRNNNDVVDNDEFPMEILLANEEMDYWHGDYWFKQNNWLFSQNGNANEKANPFMVFASIDHKQAKRIIGDLSDQTGIASYFRTMISFCMTQHDYEEYTAELQTGREQSKLELSKLSKLSGSVSLTAEESQLLISKANAIPPVRPYQRVTDNSIRTSSPTQTQSNNNNNNNNNMIGNAGGIHGIGSNNINNDNNNAVPWSETKFKGLRNNINQRGNKSKKKNKVAAVAAVAVLGTLGIATLLNPFDGGDGGDDVFDLDLGDNNNICGNCFGGDCDEDCEMCDDCECCVVM